MRDSLNLKAREVVGSQLAQVTNTNKPVKNIRVSQPLKCSASGGCAGVWGRGAHTRPYTDGCFGGWRVGE